MREFDPAVIPLVSWRQHEKDHLSNFNGDPMVSLEPVRQVEQRPVVQSAGMRRAVDDASLLLEIRGILATSDTNKLTKRKLKAAMTSIHPDLAKQRLDKLVDQVIDQVMTKD